MEVAAAAAVVLGVGVVVGVVVVIESVFHIGICCGVTGFGYGSGMERVWIGVWIGTRYLGRLCLARVELDQTRNTPFSSFTAIAGQPAQIACPDPYPDPSPFHT